MSDKTSIGNIDRMLMIRIKRAVLNREQAGDREISISAYVEEALHRQLEHDESLVVVPKQEGEDE